MLRRHYDDNVVQPGINIDSIAPCLQWWFPPNSNNHCTLTSTSTLPNFEDFHLTIACITAWRLQQASTAWRLSFVVPWTIIVLQILTDIMRYLYLHILLQFIGALVFHHILIEFVFHVPFTSFNSLDPSYWMKIIFLCIVHRLLIFPKNNGSF